MNLDEGYMDEIEYEELNVELTKNTSIFNESFEKLNLKVLSVAYKIDYCNLKCWVEISAINGTEISLPANSTAKNVEIKINFYQNNRLIYSGGSSFNANNFIGYDTIEIEIDYCDDWIEKISSTKIYATLGK